MNINKMLCYLSIICVNFIKDILKLNFDTIDP